MSDNTFVNSTVISQNLACTVVKTLSFNGVDVSVGSFHSQRLISSSVCLRELGLGMQLFGSKLRKICLAHSTKRWIGQW